MKCIACNASIDEDTAFKKFFCSLFCWAAESDSDTLADLTEF